MSDPGRAVLSALRREALAVAAGQQRLADDLSEMFLAGGAAGEGAVVRLQAFDELRQRIELLAAVAEELAAGDDGLAGRVLGRLSLASVRSAYAAALGVEAPAESGEDVELF